MKLFDNDPEEDPEDYSPELSQIIATLLDKKLWDKVSHYAKAITATQFLASYNVMWSYIHDNPDLNQQPRHSFDSNLENMVHGVAHHTYICVRCIIQGT